ncbi:MAG: S-layer homology domain-containing protein, partial [Bacillota bacterium]
MLLVVALAMPSSAAVFTDVSTDHWAYEAVNKLVAAGVIEGYPDGTFKGDQSVTRYEIAMMVDRVLERVSEERASLEDEVDAMKDGFTSAQKTELEDIIKSIVEKNMPEPKEEESEDTEGLNEKEYEQIANLVEALTFNYKAELKNLGSDLEDVEDLIDANKE